jgi:hydroxyethylthiazole kinase
MFKEILENVTKHNPLVHCITNYVTVNDVANVILASGASPIMADDLNEVEQITSICTSLVINIGTLNRRSIQSMLLAGKKAEALKHPIVLDPVGAGASALRTNTTFDLLKNIHFTVIRGNSSEIKTISQKSSTTKGVDASSNDAITEQNLQQYVVFAKTLSKDIDSVIAITGAIDIIADAKNAYIIRNGHPLMSKVTGTGCMLSGLIAGFVGANSDNVLKATAAAVCTMGLSGEIAYNKIKQTEAGTSSYRTFIIDAISNMSYETLKGGVKIEII